MTGRSMDPREADELLDLPGEGDSTYGSVVAYEHHLRGELYALKGDLSEAANELFEALSADPTDSYLRVRLALVLIEQGELNRGRRHIEKALKQDPTSEHAWLALAFYFKAKGNAEEAAQAARRAMRMDQQGSEAALWLAGFFRESGDPKSAAEILRRVVEASPDNAKASLDLAEVSLALGDHSDAQRQFSAFLELRPHRTDVVAKLAFSRLLAGDQSGAAHLFEIALMRDPSNTEIRLELIQLLINLDLVERAARHLQSLPPLEPDKAKDGIDRSCLFALAGRQYEARSLLVSWFGGFPDDPEARLALAGIEISLGRLESAELLLEEAGERWTPEQLEERVKTVDRMKRWPDGSPPCRLPAK